MIALRRATLADAERLLVWRNDPRTRAASHTTEEVQPAAHRAWLITLLFDVRRQLFIAEEDGVPVGTVRADAVDGVTELSWTVAPEARGRGVATRMVTRLAQQLPGALRAEVKVGNLASVHIAAQAGLAFDHEAAGVLYFSRPALTAGGIPT